MPRCLPHFCATPRNGRPQAFCCLRPMLLRTNTGREEVSIGAATPDLPALAAGKHRNRIRLGDRHVADALKCG
eukprot:991-Eustigmatos_ZCMA.PRE.1